MRVYHYDIKAPRDRRAFKMRIQPVELAHVRRFYLQDYYNLRNE